MLDDARLGRLLVASGRLSPDQLRDALDEQKRDPRPLSEILRSRGLLSNEELHTLGAQYDATAVVSPRRLGKFRIDAELGRGGMGVVYRAWQDDLERVVALKALPAEADPALKERFLREAKTASRLRHPNIVAVHELGEQHGEAFFTMDYVKGEPFDALLRRPGRPLRDDVRVLAAIARALHYAHGQGVVHRDVKPANILVRADGTPFLTDFGLARDLGLRDGLTMTGQILGTPAFMSPEQARGSKDGLGPASDLYSLGTVLYVVLAGAPPFTADSVYEMLDAVVRKTPPPPRSRRPEVPAALEAVCLRCLEKDPARRYPDAEALAAVLERWLRGEEIAAAPTPGRRRPLAYLLPPAAALLIAGGIVLLRGPAPALPVPVPPERRSHAFEVPDGIRDWRIAGGDLGGRRPWSVRLDGSKPVLRNAEARAAVAQAGDGWIEARMEILSKEGAYGLSFGGVRLYREARRLRLVGPTGAVSEAAAPGTGSAETLRLALEGGVATGRLDGREALRLPAEARSAVPGFFAADDGEIRCLRVELGGRLREGAAQAREDLGAELGRARSAYARGAVMDLLADGPAGSFWKTAARISRRGAELHLAGGESAAGELRADDFRNAEIRLEYKPDPGTPWLNLRFRAGPREVHARLPADAPGDWRSLHILALESRYAMILDERIELESTLSNGIETDASTFRIRVPAGGLTLRRATIEEIRGAAPERPWTILFRDGHVSPELAREGDWALRGAELAGAGALRTGSPYRDFELELIYTAEAGSRLRLGPPSSRTASTDPAPRTGPHWAALRRRGGQLEIETSHGYARAAWPGDDEGPVEIRTEGGAFSFVAIRIRPSP